jgi:hypothetical protein
MSEALQTFFSDKSAETTKPSEPAGCWFGSFDMIV